MKGRRTLVGGAVILAVGLVWLTTVLASGSAPFSPPPPGGPTPTPTPPGSQGERAPLTWEEELRERERLEREARGWTFKVSGEETAGSAITVAGVKVQLPRDTFVKSYTLAVFCIEGRPCPETPIYTLHRGESTISVSTPSGTIIVEKIAPGEEGAFDFLKEALR